MALFDLVDAENKRARQIAAAVDMDDIDLAKKLGHEDALIRMINELLQLSNLPIALSVRENDEIVAQRGGSDPYSIAELSDGERNALLISATVLTSKPSSLVLIDEPERHLHRSIGSPLLRVLFGKRPDCAFIVSTHDISLAMDSPSERALLVRSCSYNQAGPITWDVDVVCAGNIDEQLRADILGSRRTMLFVEGTDHSLDKPLYSLLFPNVSVVEKSSCREVEHTVVGIRDAKDLHWLRAFGIVDNDSRGPEDIERLHRRGVYVLSAFSVESIYFDSGIQGRIAERQVAVTGDEPALLIANAKRAALAAISSHKKRLAERVAEKAIRERFLKQLPNREDIAMRTPIVVELDVASAVRDEETTMQNWLDGGDLDALIRRYPLRETPALAEIANRLGFRNREMYLGAVRKMLRDDPQALTYARSLFGTLEFDMSVGG